MERVGEKYVVECRGEGEYQGQVWNDEEWFGQGESEEEGVENVERGGEELYNEFNCILQMEDIG